MLMSCAARTGLTHLMLHVEEIFIRRPLDMLEAAKKEPKYTNHHTAGHHYGIIGPI